MENNETRTDIAVMSESKLLLECLIEDERTGEYAEIINRITKYLQDNCCHYVVSDYIDVDVERSQEIRYCKHCKITFS
jgi:hypothetical protein